VYKFADKQLSMKLLSLLTILFLIVPAESISAKTFYIDPVKGSNKGDGSLDKPWRTLEEVYKQNKFHFYRWEKPYSKKSRLIPFNEDAPIKGGDTVKLRTGYHGKLSVFKGHINKKPIHIITDDGHKPKLSGVKLISSSNWVFKGLSISPSYLKLDKATIFTIKNHKWHGPSSNITLQDSEIFTTQDISEWNKEDWNDKVSSGLQVESSNSKVLGNKIYNIYTGITLKGNNSVVSDNQISNLAGDGIKGLGDNNTFECNLVQNPYKINKNHDDFFQSWSVGKDGKVGSGTVKNVVVRNNVFLTSYFSESDLASNAQGIGCFDGQYENWLIENNLIVVNHWHGITLMGAQNSIIRKNIVVDLWRGKPGPPWIGVNAHKNKIIKSRNNLIEENIIHKTRLSDGDSAEVKNNVKAFNLKKIFVDPYNFNFEFKVSVSKKGGAFEPSLYKRDFSNGSGFGACSKK